MEDANTFDPRRRLCPDGTCTGIIGPDGRCRECGRQSGATIPGEARTGDEVDIFGVLDAAERSADAAPAPGGAISSPSVLDAFDPNRQLCADGSCVGVIGPSGVCTVCGRAPH